MTKFGAELETMWSKAESPGKGDDKVGGGDDVVKGGAGNDEVGGGTGDELEELAMTKSGEAKETIRSLEAKAMTKSTGSRRR